MIGDQILTDVLAGNLAGMHTVLLQPIDTSAEFKGTKINRKLEKVIKKLWKTDTTSSASGSNSGFSNVFS